eukprot:CAMPEP_0170609668 /NCGR_PEP_ID=MMETSP0224-20130122/22247_1 /TAXON_ID=285029 /ORGANISM="Togula jolla, Strain CCCM 725" /LENGTH=190 /DNA_ID=CAMNT_0010934989 /DNA_START=117 /DNA_END=689 /DNA_ORIENTATION=+
MAFLMKLSLVLSAIIACQAWVRQDELEVYSEVEEVSAAGNASPSDVVNEHDAESTLSSGDLTSASVADVEDASGPTFSGEATAFAVIGDPEGVSGVASGGSYEAMYEAVLTLSVLMAVLLLRQAIRVLRGIPRTLRQAVTNASVRHRRLSLPWKLTPTISMPAETAQPERTTDTSEATAPTGIDAPSVPS